MANLKCPEQRAAEEKRAASTHLSRGKLRKIETYPGINWLIGYGVLGEHILEWIWGVAGMFVITMPLG